MSGYGDLILNTVVMICRLADLTAKDKEKKLLEKAKNELESFVYETMDKLSQEIYEKCSTEEEREKYNTLLSEASDWLYEQEEDAPKEVGSLNIHNNSFFS